ncbi:MAG TPA: hypothetical protein VK988_00650 [Acidimicrobiales bacterium]|nr:hypothetical protein [Acidimicrobiales bacterium]
MSTVIASPVAAFFPLVRAYSQLPESGTSLSIRRTPEWVQRAALRRL